MIISLSADFSQENIQSGSFELNPVEISIPCFIWRSIAWISLLLSERQKDNCQNQAVSNDLGDLQFREENSVPFEEKQWSSNLSVTYDF